MIASTSRIFAQFGSGTICVGCAKFKDLNQWYISIREIKDTASYKVGEAVKREDAIDDQEIILTFETEEQMLKVMAAFTNRTYEEMVERWKIARIKNLATGWVEKGIEGLSQ